MNRTFVSSILFLVGCPGFSIANPDAGRADNDAGLVDVAAGDGRDVSNDGAPLDLGPVACTLGELCDDANACTVDERCLASGCGGGSAVVCMGTSLRCEDGALIEETFTGVCEEAGGCVTEDVVTRCPFSCAGGACTACRITEWTQSSLPFALTESASPITQFVIDEEGGQHVLFATRRMGEEFLQDAVDYGYRTGDDATWETTPIAIPENFVADLSLAVHEQEAHFLVLSQETLTYWRPAGGSWVEEAVPGRAFRGDNALVVRADGQPHIVRSNVAGLMHAQRDLSGVWNEEPVDPPARRSGGLSALVVGGDIHVVFQNGSDGIGFARYDGSGWTVREEQVSGGVLSPSLAIAPDGTIVTSFATGDGEVAVGTISSAGLWSIAVITTMIPRVQDSQSIAIDGSGGTHVVFQGEQDRLVHYGYRSPGGSTFTFRDIVRGTERAFNLHIDNLGKLRMVSQHILSVGGSELRFSTRQTCP